jgi:hypothetical protein
MNCLTRRATTAAVALFFAATGCRSASQEAGRSDPAPLALTQPPDGVTTSTGTMRASVDGRGLGAEGWIEWSEDPTLTTGLAESDHVSVAAGSSPVALSLTLSGLASRITIYYRAVASSAAGTTRGAIDWFGTDSDDPHTLVVNSAEDVADPPPGKLTLRAAFAAVADLGTIAFAPGLDDGTIALSTVAEAHSLLGAEVYTLDPVARTWTFDGFFDRDFGPSALYAAKSLTIDASSLPRGITLAWAGGDALPARVLGVYGDLTMQNVTVTAGNAVAQPLAGDPPWTLARGGGLAVWGTLTLRNCVVAGNRVSGDTSPSRDRAAFGGGIYADTLWIEDSIVSGNSAIGFGAAGGGIYSVGGYSTGLDSSLLRSSITGNRVTAQHAYGGGVFSDGAMESYGRMRVESCTIARNLAEDHPGLAEDARFQYYTRGGGLYASNGTLDLAGSTVVENAVTGHPATFAGRPNLGGGGMGATIGDAHVVESMSLQQSIVAGNTLNGQPEDVFSGSVIDFYGWGYDLVGRLDFSRILVPIPDWSCLSRKHWPKKEDRDGVSLADVVSTDGVHRAASIVSAGTDAGEPAVLWYEPGAAAIGRVPQGPYQVSWVWLGYSEFGVPTDDFLNQLLAVVRARYGVLGADFGASYGDLTGVTYYGPAYTWPSNPENADWIQFWRDVDLEIGDRLGQVGLGDDFWSAFPRGQLGQEFLWDWSTGSAIERTPEDQLGTPRAPGSSSAIGAVDAGSTPSAFWQRAESGH